MTSETERMQAAMARVVREHVFFEGVWPYRAKHSCICGVEYDNPNASAGGTAHSDHVSAELMRMLHEDFGLREDDRFTITGDPGPGYPEYRFEFSTEHDGEDAEKNARAFANACHERGGWADGPHVASHSRLVTDWHPTDHPTDTTQETNHG